VKISINALLCLAALGLTSCFSTMKLKVDALNMQAFKLNFLYTYEHLDNMEKQVTAVLTPDYQKELQNGTEKKVIDFINSNPNIPVGNRPALIAQVTIKYNAATAQITVKASDLLTKIAALKATPGDAAVKDYDVSLVEYKKAVSDFSGTLAGFKELLIGTALGSTELANLLLLDADIAQKATVLKTSFGESILSDPMSSVVASVPRQYWSKIKANINLNSGTFNKAASGDKHSYRKASSRVNFTSARTLIGNADIAFKMESPGEFVVKGVRVDADEAVRAASKVLAQGIKYIAYSTGVPIPKGSGGNQPVVIPELQQLASKKTEMEQLKQSVTTETEAFLAILLSVSKDIQLTGTGAAEVAKRNAAMARVLMAYQNYTDALNK
jgi:hypothetical protein